MKAKHKFRISDLGFRIFNSGSINSTSAFPDSKFSLGFTLIEVLVALTIVSISVVSVYAAFAGISDTLARVDNYNRSVLIGMEKLWEAEEALLQTDDVNVTNFSGELKESDTRFLKWEFIGTDLTDYPNLKEINLTLQWQQGKRSGTFNVGTYLRVKEKPQ